jgi:hypothetical protein
MSMANILDQFMLCVVGEDNLNMMILYMVVCLIEPCIEEFESRT